ncbi:zinc finger protein 43 [Rhinichthys klamathensis goyatoka]|uniref:zinc finger protein 43 n=1 Tax=Rhinichthys klamathensis goyatoka TaxID=3034132 RepID=UPI0024B5DF23|nr:zinc finger protein 43 [Rhinichthys klamathensis goyatoka]
MAYSMDLGGGDAFICTECGEGFSQYPKLVEHMAIHGINGLFSSDGLSISNGSCINASIEVALHENGMLTVVDRSVLSNFTFLFGKPSTKSLWCQPPNQEALTSSKMPGKQYAQFKCERCGQVFKTLKSLQLHQQYRALEQGLKCTLCCKVFNDRESLQSHLQNHAHERFYSCGHCGKRFLRQETLLSHQKQWHGSIGSKTSRSEEDQENSMDRSYPCKICGLRFFWLSDLQSHLNSHSRVNKPTTEAMQKQESFGEEESKKNGSDSVNEPCRCGLCGEHFNQISDLREHHKTQHPDEVEVKDSSDLPAKTKQQYHGVMQQMFAKQQKQPLRPSLRGRHRGMSRANFSGKIFSCKLCHRVFVHSSSLSRHMRYHKGTLHACVYCGRHFPQRCDVTRHVAMYHSSALQPKPPGESKTEHEVKSGEQEPAKASTQTKSDSEQEDLEEENQPESKADDRLFGSRYTRTYTPRMKYKCKECCRVFGLLSVYKRHVYFHKRSPCKVLLSCPLCPSRFTFLSALHSHLENHHKGDSEIDGTKAPETNVVDSENQQEDADAEKADKNADNVMSLEIMNESSECSQT